MRPLLRDLDEAGFDLPVVLLIGLGLLLAFAWSKLPKFLTEV